jgi:NAD(P)-dependent dehydrogenase (short-subunit alcohol dehydrogenase family)
MRSLRDQVVLITGASSGIGRATAIEMARQEARVVLASRDTAALEALAKEIGSNGGQALVATTDVTDREQCQKAVESAVQQFGRLDVLICSAGISMRSDFEHSNLEAMERVVRVNFLGTVYATYFAIPHVKKSRGSLVAISSLTGLRGVPSYGIYGATKFAIEGLYESLRIELGRSGVHVGTVSPGFVNTPLRDRVLGADGMIMKQPPDPPFRVWPVEKCVKRIVRLVVKRRRQALLPAFTGPLMTLDDMLGRRIGDWVLAWRFPPERDE